MTIGTCIRITLATALMASAANGQALDVERLVGEWNNLNTGDNIEIISTGRANISNIGNVAWSGTTVQGGNFAIEGRGFQCFWSVTVFQGGLRSNWQLRASTGSAQCPRGQFERVGDGRSSSNSVPAARPPEKYAVSGRRIVRYGHGGHWGPDIDECKDRDRFNRPVLVQC